MKIVRVEDGSLSEIVSVFLELTRGKEIPTGSVALIFSATHLLRRGVAGYVSDLWGEVARVSASFKGGIICLSGVPIFGNGFLDRTLTRAVLELNTWFKATGECFPQGAWNILVEDINSQNRGGTFLVETFRHPMPVKDSLLTCSWESGGWTSPSGVLPCSPALEEKIVITLVQELNNMFNVGLDSSPIQSRGAEGETIEKPVKVLLIGGSHAIKEGEVLSDRGYEVITCAIAGWRANKTAAEQMAEEVQEALKL
jgi:hypothetical protein